MKLFLDDISRFVFSYNNLWRNEAHPLNFRIFSLILADVLILSSLSLSFFPSLYILPPLLLLLPYLYFLSHSRYPLTFAIYSALLFFSPSTSRTFPKRNELFRTSRFRGVSFTVAQVSRLSQLRFVDVLQLLFGRSCLRGTNVTCSFSHLAVVYRASFPTQIPITTFIHQHCQKFLSIVLSHINYFLDFDIHYYLYPANKPLQLFTNDSFGIFSGFKKMHFTHPSMYLFPSYTFARGNEKNARYTQENAKLQSIGFP